MWRDSWIFCVRNYHKIIKNIQVQTWLMTIRPLLVTEKEAGGHVVRPPPADGLDSLPQQVEAFGILSPEEMLEVLEEQLVLHQEIDVWTVEATEI